jgi:sporulation protein YlmC with PRC-barrel domain
MSTGRVLHAGLQVLDRQLVDRSGRLCGKVDDLELTEPDAEGRLYVGAILSGPGALLARTGHTRLGGWFRRVAALAFDSDRDDPVRIPFHRVAAIGNHVTLSMDSEEVAGFGGERWTRDHVIGHIPGSRHRAPG